jgi:periplasmic divalent cation tolerance protein
MLMIGWTTVKTREEAGDLARHLIERGLVACVQIDGPLCSVYRWEGRLEESAEFRLCLKFLAKHEPDVATQVLSEHPYDTPEWITVRAENVSEKYLSWVMSNPSNSPFHKTKPTL